MEEKGTNTSDPAETGAVQFGSFEFFPQRHELRKGGLRITMSASQTRLLHLFTGRPDELITQDEIAAHLRADSRTVDVTRGINTAINRLRHHLREASKSPSRIETVIGLGYRFVSDSEQVKVLEEAEQVFGLPEEPSVAVAVTNVTEIDQAEPIRDKVSAPETLTLGVDQQWGLEGEAPFLGRSTWRPPGYSRGCGRSASFYLELCCSLGCTGGQLGGRWSPWQLVHYFSPLAPNRLLASRLKKPRGR